MNGRSMKMELDGNINNYRCLGEAYKCLKRCKY